MPGVGVSLGYCGCLCCLKVLQPLCDDFRSKTIRHYHKPQKIVKKIVYTSGHYRNGAECYFCTTSKDSVNVITGVMRSFV